jgi:hypothetical protein
MSEILNWLDWLNGLAVGIWIGSMIQEYRDKRKKGE